MNPLNQSKSVERRPSRASRVAIACFVLFFFSFPSIDAARLDPLISPNASRAQGESIELQQTLLDLQNPWTVMCVAAHPDDEDGATLTILRRKHGVHTVTVFSTYGEGGQNVVGPELYEELGAIRAKETIEAAKIQGSEPYFLGLRDFGYSKSADEAFRVWGHDEALRRLVLKIRELRPDVIITNHDTVSGHGHHQATGRLVLEAFDAAADAKRFPDQLGNGVGPWQAKRLFVRFQFQSEARSRATEDEALREGRIVAFDPNEPDPRRGTTYAQQALAALQQHATQGPWPKTLPPGGRPMIRYRLVRSANDVDPLPIKAQSFLDGLQFPRAVSDQLMPRAARAILQMSLAEHHQSVLSALLTARKGGLFATTEPREWQRLQFMRLRLDNALAEASGIKVRLMPQNDVLFTGKSTKVALQIANEGTSTAKLESLKLQNLLRPATFKFPHVLPAGATITLDLLNLTPRTTGSTVPAADHLYDGRLFGEPLSAVAEVEIDGARFIVPESRRVDIAPLVEITNIKPAPLVVTPATMKRPSTFHLRLINHQATAFEGTVGFFKAGGSSAGHRRAIKLTANEVRDIEMVADPGVDYISPGKASTHRVRYDVSFTVATSNGPRTVTKRTINAVWSDARVAPELRIGYVRSFDDTLRDSLAALGVQAKELTVDDIRTSDLSNFHAIIIDNRGYQAHPDLISANGRLLDYAREGGTLIVFYHRTNEWNPDARASRPQLAPYPIIIGNARVTDENAPIEFIDSSDPLLNFPNKISNSDFDGWIQERGLYYPETWDSHYRALFATRDPGEKPLRGGLLAADYGRGHYIYTSMVWYRQLRAGVPGAYRMLANMISLGRERKMNAER